MPVHIILPKERRVLALFCYDSWTKYIDLSAMQNMYYNL